FVFRGALFSRRRFARRGKSGDRGFSWLPACVSAGGGALAPPLGPFQGLPIYGYQRKGTAERRGGKTLACAVRLLRRLARDAVRAHLDFLGRGGGALRDSGK